MLVLLIERVDIAVVFLELVSLEVAFQHISTAICMLEFAFSVHLPISEMTLVLVALRPSEDALSIDYVLLPLSLVGPTVLEYSVTNALPHVSVPIALVFCENTIVVACSAIELETVAMSHCLVVF